MLAGDPVLNQNWTFSGDPSGKGIDQPTLLGVAHIIITRPMIYKHVSGVIKRSVFLWCQLKRNNILIYAK